MSRLSLIVAASENDVIGNDGDLPWRLSADLKRFKELTMGHHIVMGRKTFESIGRLLPGRKTIILTRQPDFTIDGAIVVQSVDKLFQVISADESPFVTGGSEIYSLLLPHVSRLFLTRVHTQIEGDTHLPPIDWTQWRRSFYERHPKDSENEFDYSFEVYARVMESS